MKKIAKATLFFLMLCITLSCSKDEDFDQEECSIIDVSDIDPDFDILVINNEGNQMGIDINEQTGKLSSICYYDQISNRSNIIIFDDDQTNFSIVEDGYIYMLSNINNNTCDFGVITNNEEIVLMRDVLLPSTDWNAYLEKLSTIEYKLDSLKNTTRVEYRSNKPRSAFWKDEVFWKEYLLPEMANAASIISGAYSCARESAKTLGTFGYTLPVALATCGSHFQNTMDIALDKKRNNSDKMAWDVSKMLSHAITNCVSDSKLDCVKGVLSGLGATLYHAYKELSSRESSIKSLDGLLSAGYGSVQINLTWNKPADIDLHVMDPQGNHIYYQNNTSPTGGYLDVDDRYGTGPENVFWHNNPPNGKYDVSVNYFADHYNAGVINWYVTVARPIYNGIYTTDRFQGTLTSEGQTKTVTSFIVGNQTRVSNKECYDLNEIISKLEFRK